MRPKRQTRTQKQVKGRIRAGVPRNTEKQRPWADIYNFVSAARVKVAYLSSGNHLSRSWPAKSRAQAFDMTSRRDTHQRITGPFCSATLMPDSLPPSPLTPDLVELHKPKALHLDMATLRSSTRCSIQSFPYLLAPAHTGRLSLQQILCAIQQS